jgi:sugar fermentation stimulation protein A
LEVEIKFSPPLREGVLVRRYKRFLADVKFPGGEQVTALCPNTGSMKSCCEPGRPVMLSCHPDPGRKLPYTWQMIRMEKSWVGINTTLPNGLVAMAVKYGMVPELISYPGARREVAVGNGSRLDFMLEGPPGRCYMEVKNVTLAEDGAALFPDAKTARGRKHLEELVRLQKEGNRSIMLFLVQRNDVEVFKPADAVDPAYGEALRRAVDAGVEVLVYQAKVSPEGLKWGDLMKKDLS